MAEIDKQLKMLKCMADKTRLSILTLLRDGERCVCEIFKELGKEQSLVSHHLAYMRKCGIVSSRQEGKKVIYKLADPSLAKLLDQVERLSDKICAD
ncbi:MAG: hypothetical protein APU95_02435 [Hadesarchaea archaeon YNP_N21]|jgi:ArsR family transcriptional regulator|nr:MAG: hypothetical protein APU95_02435 [Hadesarchaea archaeon YNP_N21]